MLNCASVACHQRNLIRWNRVKGPEFEARGSWSFSGPSLSVLGYHLWNGDNNAHCTWPWRGVRGKADVAVLCDCKRLYEGAGLLLWLSHWSELPRILLAPQAHHASLPSHEANSHAVFSLNTLFPLITLDSFFMARLLYPCIHEATLKCSRTPTSHCSQGFHRAVFYLPFTFILPPVSTPINTS